MTESGGEWGGAAEASHSQVPLFLRLRKPESCSQKGFAPRVSPARPFSGPPRAPSVRLHFSATRAWMRSPGLQRYLQALAQYCRLVLQMANSILQ